MCRDNFIRTSVRKLAGGTDNAFRRVALGKTTPAINVYSGVLYQALGWATLIVDCRSSTYKTVWNSPVEKTVEIQISTVVDGVRKVVTHMSKKTRGEIVRLLLQSRSLAKTPEDLYAIVSETYPCALTPSDGVEPWILEVIAV